MNHNPEFVEVCPDRFARLEELEKNLPDIIKKAISDYKKENLIKLHEKDKTNPEGVKNRVKKYILKNKDKINEKRREKRRENLENKKIQVVQTIPVKLMNNPPIATIISFN